MRKKSRALGFKKGDQVVFFRDSYENISVTAGCVSLVRKDMPFKRWDGVMVTGTVVYVKCTSMHGQVFTHKFCDTYGPFQRNPEPVWRLRHLRLPEYRNLVKRAQHASKLHALYEEAARRIEIDVEQEAREWRYREQERRKKNIPHGRGYLNNVIARMGFKRPKSD